MPISQAKALYDYDRQTDEELSFKEEAILDVYDTTDADWTLVGEGGSYGFAPANYIELTKGTAAPTPASPALPSRPSIPAAPDSDDEQQPPTQTARHTRAPLLLLRASFRRSRSRRPRLALPSRLRPT
jgi:hypothetical protein